MASASRTCSDNFIKPDLLEDRDESSNTIFIRYIPGGISFYIIQYPLHDHAYIMGAHFTYIYIYIHTYCNNISDVLFIFSFIVLHALTVMHDFKMLIRSEYISCKFRHLIYMRNHYVYKCFCE